MTTTNSAGVFEGIKFWVAQRVPSRSRFIDLITNNGGTLEPLDRRADILISDHARNDCPPNSFSWRFIEDSIKQGRLQDKESYRIGRPLSEPRPVGSSETMRPRRVPYTVTDDAILVARVKDHAASGGNKVYMELESEYPHHTWQSWRDRWMKRLRFLPHDVMERMVTEAPLPNSIPASSMPSTNRSQPQGSSTRQNLPARQPSSQRPAPPPQVHHAERTGSPNFTDADDTLLENHVRSNVESGKMWNSKFIYEELAQKYPHHSASSWQHRFTEMWRRHKVSMKDWKPRDNYATEEPETQSYRSSRESPLPDMTSAKERFYRDLQICIDTEAADGEAPVVEKWHRICDFDFELWDLYRAVLQQKCPIDQVDWELVGEDMSLDWVALPEVTEQIEGCWDKYLATFHELTADFSHADQEAENVGEIVEDDAASGLIQQQVVNNEVDHIMQDAIARTQGRNEEDPGLLQKRPAEPRSMSLMPSSPPNRPIHLRTEFEQSSPILSSRKTMAGSQVNRKRPRLEPRSETPSTPEFGFRTTATRTHTPTASRKRRRLTMPDTKDVFSRTNIDSGEADNSNAPRRQPSSQRDSLPHLSPSLRTVHERVDSPAHSLKGNGSTRRSLPWAASTRTPSTPVIVDDADLQGDKDNSEEVFATIERFESEGYSREIVIEALYRTSMDPERAVTVMRSLRVGDGVPSDEKGIWTIRDDEVLKLLYSTRDRTSNRARRFRDRLIKKHGVSIMNLRRRFLADAEEIGFSL